MTVRTLDPAQLPKILSKGLLIDLRATGQWLDRHIRASIPLLYEPGPGFATRARDLLPLDAHLVLLEDEESPLDDAADRLRGKGFEVVGYLAGGVDGWAPEHVTQTRVAMVDSNDKPSTVLDVGDPGVIGGIGMKIPAERLWDMRPDLDPSHELGVLAGFGVRAAAAVGILEKLGFTKVTLVRTRPESDRPITAGPEAFRVGGPG